MATSATLDLGAYMSNSIRTVAPMHTPITRTNFWNIVRPQGNNTRLLKIISHAICC